MWLKIRTKRRRNSATQAAIAVDQPLLLILTIFSVVSLLCGRRNGGSSSIAVETKPYSSVSLIGMTEPVKVLTGDAESMC